MRFDISILNEEERDEALNIATEISMAAMEMDFEKVRIQLDSIQEIFDDHYSKIENKLRAEEHNNFLQLIEKNENGGQDTLTIPKHRGKFYWPIFRKDIMKETEKAFGILDLEATEEMRQESLKKWKSEPIHWLPKSKIIVYQGLYFIPSDYCQISYMDKFKSSYIIKTFNI